MGQGGKEATLGPRWALKAGCLLLGRDREEVWNFSPFPFVFICGVDT